MDESKRGSDLWNLSLEEICGRPYEDTGGAFSDQEETAYTGEDIRFTAKGKTIYAIAMRWPKDGTLVIRSMARMVKQEGQDSTNFHGLIKEIRVLGEEKGTVAWHQKEDGLYVECGLCREFPVVVCVNIL